MSPLKKWYRFDFVLLYKTSIVFTSVDETTVSLLDFLSLKHDSEFGKPQYFFSVIKGVLSSFASK